WAPRTRGPGPRWVGLLDERLQASDRGAAREDAFIDRRVELLLQGRHQLDALERAQAQLVHSCFRTTASRRSLIPRAWRRSMRIAGGCPCTPEPNQHARFDRDYMGVIRLRAAQVTSAPVGGQPGDLFECAWLFEQ